MNPLATIERVVQRPALLRGMGRLLGFGDAEQKALVQQGPPKMALAVVGLGAVALGVVYAQRRWGLFD